MRRFAAFAILAFAALVYADEEAGGGGMGHLEDDDDPELDPVLDEERQQSMPVKWRSAHTINERAAGYVLEVLFKRIESESLDEKYMPSFLHDPIRVEVGRRNTAEHGRSEPPEDRHPGGPAHQHDLVEGGDPGLGPGGGARGS